VELTTWADQVLKKRLENVRGVGAVNLVGATKREINIYLDPRRWRPMASRPTRWCRRARENQDLPVGAIRSLPRSAWCRSTPASRPEDFAASSSRPQRRRHPPGPGGPRATARRSWKPGAVQRPAHAAAVGAKAQDENTIEVVDGLNAAVPHQAELPPGVRLEPISDNSPHPRGGGQRAPDADRGRLLTVLIVFLFLNSWRSTVITGLTLPIALIGTFLFMYCSASPST
jgi:HAE1 family hydrophobic/amphiphilic exporter-1